MSIKRFTVEKLIRDGIPAALEDRKITSNIMCLEEEGFIQQLKKKLLEEAAEVAQANARDEICEELADLLEVIQMVSKTTGITMEQIEQKRIEKKEKNGGFENRTFCSFIEVEEDNQAINYYLDRPDKYPEINPKGHQPECLFCQISLQSEPVQVLARFEHCYVIKDQFPVSNGHILIIPYEHTENWFTANEALRLDMLHALNTVKELLDEEYTPDGYNIGANCGKAAGQSIMHLHLHLIPRYQGDIDNPKGGVRGVIPAKQHY